MERKCQSPKVAALKSLGFLSPMNMGERWPRSGRSGGWGRHMRLPCPQGEEDWARYCLLYSLTGDLVPSV